MVWKKEKFQWSITLEEVPGLGIRWPGYKITITFSCSDEENNEKKDSIYSYRDTDRPLWAAAV